MGVAAHSSSYIFQKFGTPIVAQGALVFAGAGKEYGKRIICISRNSGDKRWEIKDEGEFIIPWVAIGNEVIITRGADILSCSLSDGRCKSLYNTFYSGCSLKEYAFPVILVEGERDNEEYLALIDIRQAKKIWEVQNHIKLVAMGNGVILCEAGERKYKENKSYSYTNRKLIAISISDGSVFWSVPLEKECQSVKGVAVDDYFVIDTGGTIRCVNQGTGKIVNELCVQSNPYACVTLVAQNKSIIMWSEKKSGINSFYIIYSLSVPGLVMSELIKTEYGAASAQSFGDILIGMDIGRVWAYNLKTGENIWRGGQWSWNGIHDGWLYFSTMEKNGTHTSVNQIDVKTGNIKKLYEEIIPDSGIQLKAAGQKAAMTNDDVTVIIEERANGDVSGQTDKRENAGGERALK